MFKMTPGLEQLLASRRRPAMGADYDFIVTREPDIRRALGLAAEGLFGIMDEHAAIAGDLASIPMTAEHKAAVSKGSHEEEPRVVREMAQALRRVLDLLAPETT